MSDFSDAEQIPLLWINLHRARKRRARMSWALHHGGWHGNRFDEIDEEDTNHLFLPIPNLLSAGTKLPGIYKSDEKKPKRRTKREELACLASWKRAIIQAKQIETPSGWILIMEDDLGSSLAAPEAWAHSLLDLIKFCPDQTLAIQLAPISATLRQHLAEEWHQSRGKCLAVRKENVRSHGNGAVLLHKKALDLLTDPILSISNYWIKNWHPLLYPWRIRPVADKWIYGSLPANSCQVATYPHFCLEAEDSTLHIDHVKAFHKPSRDVTMRIWEEDHRRELIKKQRTWDQIKK